MFYLNQPFGGQLGDILIAELEKDYHEFIIFSAFAKNSGVLRLKTSIENFKRRGGIVTAFIGIDLDGTSYEALLNLFNLCDELYVVHSENQSTTYHSKIYLLKNNKTAWCSVGSNNFTGGGLWTNFESCSIDVYPADAQELSSIREIADKYKDDGYLCSARISSVEDIDNLLNSQYITKEVSQRISFADKRKGRKSAKSNCKLFGSEKVSLPLIERQPTHASERAQYPPKVDFVAVQPPAFTNEQFWFEMRALTGGSRNILDLSKKGKIAHGSVTGTVYEHPDSRYMQGGVRFFDMDPEDVSVTKDIRINYLGKDYFPSTIKYTPSNSNWRIQLTGSPEDDSDKLSAIANRGEFIHKVLIFEKIDSSYYVLSVLNESELDNLKQISNVWAYNGNSTTGRALGML